MTYWISFPEIFFPTSHFFQFILDFITIFAIFSQFFKLILIYLLLKYLVQVFNQPSIALILIFFHFALSLTFKPPANFSLHFFYQEKLIVAMTFLIFIFFLMEIVFLLPTFMIFYHFFQPIGFI